MKRIALLLCGVLAGTIATSQIFLTGSSYSQNFDGIAGGLPIGWELYTSASPTSLGNNISTTKFTSTTTDWKNLSGSFKNCASANGFSTFASGTTSAQTNSIDRALAVRQVGATSTSFPGSDSAAFTLHIGNTNGLMGFSGNFKLQSLDSTSPRIVLWQVEYATGNNPTTFTVLPVTGTLSTGGETYSSNIVSFNLGTLIDNINTDVWIRITPSGPSTGSGNRPTTAIDDFSLSWSGSGIPSNYPNIVTLTPADNSSNIPATTNSVQVIFDKQVTLGTGSMNIKNVTDQANQTIALSSANTTIAAFTATITGISLLQGKNYYITFDSTAFDTAGYRGTGIYDSTTWNFSTVAPPPATTSLNETFDASCPAGLPMGWIAESVIGSQTWNCGGTTANYGNNGTKGLQMNGYQGANNTNEDWLITPQLDLNVMTSTYFHFDHWKRFVGNDLEVLLSNNYTGIGDPNAATWINLNVILPSADTGVWKTYQTDISSYKTSLIHLAFKYTSTTTDGRQSRLDNVFISATPTSIKNVYKSALNFMVLGNAKHNEITLSFDVKEGDYKISICDLSGREVYSTTTLLTRGIQRKNFSGFNLTNGIYFVNLRSSEGRASAKFVVE